MNEKRLLVVDDEVAFGAFVRRVAQGLDFAVEVTSTADAFKEAYERFHPTVIVLDIVMPETDGIELIRWLGTMNCTARITSLSAATTRTTRRQPNRWATPAA